MPCNVHRVGGESVGGWTLHIVNCASRGSQEVGRAAAEARVEELEERLRLHEEQAPAHAHAHAHVRAHAHAHIHAHAHAHVHARTRAC
eukprot:6195057-Pleurochrysis_carterae.AAC.2